MAPRTRHSRSWCFPGDRPVPTERRGRAATVSGRVWRGLACRKVDRQPRSSERRCTCWNPRNHASHRANLVSLFSAEKSTYDSDRGGTRTHDQRINLPHRFSPTAFDPRRCAVGKMVEGLDSPIAIAGVPRRVSEAGPGDPSGPCLLIAQSFPFSNRHVGRYRLRCGKEGSQGVPANCGMHSSRFGFFPREAPIGLLPLEVRCSTD